MIAIGLVDVIILSCAVWKRDQIAPGTLGNERFTRSPPAQRSASPDRNAGLAMRKTAARAVVSRIPVHVMVPRA
jgi:hypothetical protein